MARYIDINKVRPDCISTKGGVAVSQSQLASQPAADVIERAEYEKLHKEYKHYRRLAEQDNNLRSKINKAIENIDDLDPITERVGLQVKQEILNILKEI